MNRVLSWLVAGLAALSGGCRDVPAEEQVCEPAGGPTRGAGFVIDEAAAELDRRERGRCPPVLLARFAGAPSGTPAYARLVKPVAWREGQTVGYAADFRLPVGFHRRLQGQVALMRRDDFPFHPHAADYSGVVISGYDGFARLVLQRHGDPGETPLTTRFRLPEGRWFRLAVRQRLSSGADALNQVRVDGSLLANTTAPNLKPGRGHVRRVRFGLVATSKQQRLPLALRLADPTAHRIR